MIVFEVIAATSHENSRSKRRAFPPRLARCETIGAPKAPVEIGQVAKAAVIGNRADRDVAAIGFAKPSMSLRKTLHDQKFREGGALLFEQALQIARCHTEMGGHASDRNLAAMAVRDNMGFGELQSGRAQLLEIAVSPKREREQILNMTCGEF